MSGVLEVPSISADQRIHFYKRACQFMRALDQFRHCYETPCHLTWSSRNRKSFPMAMRSSLSGVLLWSRVEKPASALKRLQAQAQAPCDLAVGVKHPAHHIAQSKQM